MLQDAQFVSYNVRSTGFYYYGVVFYCRRGLFSPVYFYTDPVYFGGTRGATPAGRRGTVFFVMGLCG